MKSEVKREMGAVVETYLSIEELAKYLGVSEKTIRRWVLNQDIPYHKIMKFIRFRLSEVERWIESGGKLSLLNDEAGEGAAGADGAVLEAGADSETGAACDLFPDGTNGAACDLFPDGKSGAACDLFPDGKSGAALEAVAGEGVAGAGGNE
jgi:excisionase family DNA binding protein